MDGDAPGDQDNADNLAAVCDISGGPLVDHPASPGDDEDNEDYEDYDSDDSE